jgi:hypothetical protein
MLDAVRLLSSLAGAGLLAYGGWLHYEPLGYIVGGGLLFGLGVIGAYRAR